MAGGFMGVMAVLALVFAIVSPYVEAQASAPAPSPTSDGNSFFFFLTISFGVFRSVLLAAISVFLIERYILFPLL